jgi:hypothetical protein
MFGRSAADVGSGRQKMAREMRALMGEEYRGEGGGVSKREQGDLG